LAAAITTKPKVSNTGRWQRKTKGARVGGGDRELQRDQWAEQSAGTLPTLRTFAEAGLVHVDQFLDVHPRVLRDHRTGVVLVAGVHEHFLLSLRVLFLLLLLLPFNALLFLLGL